MRAVTVLMVVALVLTCAGIAEAQSVAERACKERNLSTETDGISGLFNRAKVSLEYGSSFRCREKSTKGGLHTILDTDYMQTCLCYAWLMSKWYPDDPQYSEAVIWYNNELVTGAFAGGFQCMIDVSPKGVDKPKDSEKPANQKFTVTGLVPPGVENVQVTCSVHPPKSTQPHADGSYAIPFDITIDSKFQYETIVFSMELPVGCSSTKSAVVNVKSPEPEGTVTSVKLFCEPEIKVNRGETKTFTIQAQGSGPMIGKFFKGSTLVGSRSLDEANNSAGYIFHRTFSFEDGGGYYSASVTDVSGNTKSAGNICLVQVIPGVVSTRGECRKKTEGSDWYAHINIHAELFNPDPAFIHGKFFADDKLVEEHLGLGLKSVHLKYTHDKPNTYIQGRAIIEYSIDGENVQECVNLKNRKVWNLSGLIPKPAPRGSQSIGALYLSDDLICEICEECDDSFSDVDQDGIEDGLDNCLKTPNPQQEDSDGDRIGDACDNCPGIPNSRQEDADGDLLGDKCDYCPDDPTGGETDSDGDGRGDECDNCPQDFNPDQADNDGDGLGNLCDNCIDDYNPDQTDDDGNGVGNACEEDQCVPPDCCPDYPEPCDGVCWEVCPEGYEPDPSDCSLCVEEPCVPPTCCPEYPLVCGPYCIPAGTKCCDPGIGGWCLVTEECCGSVCCNNPGECCLEKTGITGCCVGGNCCPGGGCCAPEEECCGGGCCRPGSRCVDGKCVAI